LFLRGDDVLVKGDQLYIVSSKEYMPEALKFYGKSESRVDNIMIIGGGLVGRFIAKELEHEISIKIIEHNESKAIELADILRRSLVIHGDGSNLDLLTYEGLDEMDEFIAVTGDDEANIITSLVAKHVKIPRTITLLRKMEYLPLTPAIGIDSIVSKQQITVNAVQKFIRSRQIASYAEIPGMDAEIVEFIASAKSKIIDKPLMKVKFPQKAIVGSVFHGRRRD
jgi:trk system potassium uptake protein TrkA